MKKVRGILCLLLVVVFALSVALTGCGDNGGGEATTTAESTGATSESTVATLDPYEVKVYFVGTKQYPETNLIEEEVNKKLADINTTVKYQVFPWGEYANKMSMIIASGEQFDIAFMGTWTNYYPNVAKGAFVDLTDLVKEKLPKFSQIIDPKLLEGPKVKGRLYGLPTNKEVPEAFGIEVDKEFATQIGANFDSVKTYADLEPILKTAKEKLPADVFPFVFQATTVFRDGTFDNLGDVTIPGVVRMNDDSTKVLNQFEQPEFMANWQLAYKWVQAGLANKNGATKGAPDYWNARKGFARSENMGPLPEYQGTKSIIKRVYIGQKVASTGGTVGAMSCFSKTSKNLDRAFMYFDRYATDADIYNLVGFGIEGKHYKVTDASTNPKRIGFIDDKTTEDSVGYIHSGGAWSLGGNWFNSFLQPTDPADRNDSIKKFNETAVTSKLLGFSFDPEPVKTEIAACNNVYQELGVPLNCGAVDPAKIAPKFIEKLKAAGVDKIIAEKQKQIDQWKKDNGK